MSIALVRNPGEGQAYTYFGAELENVVSTTETDGVVTVSRLHMQRDEAPPLHVHSREDESWVVLSGRVRFWAGSTSLDTCEVHDAEPGAYIYGPRSVPHTLQPITSTAVILTINSPGAVEGYFKGVGHTDTSRTADDIADLLAEYGVKILDNPPSA
ncbi:cupin domain-containing protein [Actinoallomurus sp. NBC_01490]|jgi:mannose-6-phosphate isomerase-like protein (cupin superfamily)|uniref:cupin domain-containing protein n=1 Tax=Actinoallomurus sp. NBC_01490 TaxID=2903557 RepID=UPI002E3568A9|nr:cupin domain-containing protein [Actinoallomurus sp. NBC_01490]